MKYNSKYDRWVTNSGLVYRYDSKQDKLVLCKLKTAIGGYLQLNVSKPKRTLILVHRLVYETFVGDIPQGYEIDHINTVSDDNRVENLRCVTSKENMNNPLTLQHMSEARKGYIHSEDTKQKISESHLANSKSDFGKKYFKYYGYSCSKNPKQYDRELKWYRYHNNKCRWEMDKNERN